jgi:hypothetical protein
MIAECGGLAFFRLQIRFLGVGKCFRLLLVAWAGLVQTIGSFGGVAGFVIGQLTVADRETRMRRMVRIGDQLAPQLQRADVRGILITNPVGGESFVQNGKREVTDVFCGVADLE